MSAADQWAWERSWRRSDEGKESMRRSHEGVLLQVDDAGRFRIEDCPIGTRLELDAELHARSWSVLSKLIRRLQRRTAEPILTVKRSIIIPKTDSSAEQPYDLGRVTQAES